MPLLFHFGDARSEFVDLKILVEETKEKRGKMFKFKPYLEMATLHMIAP